MAYYNLEEAQRLAAENKNFVLGERDAARKAQTADAGAEPLMSGNENVWLPTLREKKPTDEELKWAMDYFVKNPLVLIEPAVVMETDPALLDHTYEARRRRELLCLVQFALILGQFALILEKWATDCARRILEADAAKSNPKSEEKDCK